MEEKEAGVEGDAQSRVSMEGTCCTGAAAWSLKGRGSGMLAEGARAGAAAPNGHRRWGERRGNVAGALFCSIALQCNANANAPVGALKQGSFFP